MKVALALSTKDRCDLTRQTLPPLIEGAVKHRYHLFVFDGSDTEEGERLPFDIGYPTCNIVSNVRGGAGAAIVKALYTLLIHPEQYDVIGLVENDVLLTGDWFPRTLDLFDRGDSDGLLVGAASPRAYQDRILIQRDGYAVMHNIGAGCIFFTRAAAQLVLDTFRGGFTTDNRRIFQRLSGIDIGSYWAFRAAEHWLTADWHWEAMLAAHGYASLALTPSLCEMVGQVPPLAEQGLTMASGDDPAEAYVARHYADSLTQIREGASLNIETKLLRDTSGVWTVAPHQLGYLGGTIAGWACKDERQVGIFTFKGDANANLSFMAAGPVTLMVQGSDGEPELRVADTASGFEVNTSIPANTMIGIDVPGNLSMREVNLRVTKGSLRFHGLQLREPPMLHPFDVGAFLNEMPVY